MNTDFQDIKSYKKPNICENLYPNLTLALFAPLPAQPAQPAQPVQLNVYPACPVGRNYRTGVKSFLHLFLWGEACLTGMESFYSIQSGSKKVF